MQLDSSQSTVANFVQKSFEIITNEENSESIEWLPSGREFIIKDTELFETVILPHYFRHRNINSFIRQLNMYGFHKSRKEPTKNIFSHPSFLKGRPDILINVKRKLKEDKNEENQPPQPAPLKKSKSEHVGGKVETVSRFEPVLSREAFKSREQFQNVAEKREKELQRTAVKQEHLVSLCSMELMEEFPENPRSNQDWPFKSLIEKSQIMELNPDVYGVKYENITSLNHIEEVPEQDFWGHGCKEAPNPALQQNAEEIENERKLLNVRMAGYNILNTMNFMSDFNL